LSARVSVAYLAPEIPALSATFVYEELLEVERRGISVLPFSVHPPASKVQSQALLGARCRIVYDRPKWRIAISGLFELVAQQYLRKAVRLLIHDLRRAGNLSLSLRLMFQFLAAGTVASVLRRERIGHLHIHFAHVPTQIGMYAAILCGITFTVMAHANDIFERGFLLKEKAERARKFLTISDYNLTHLRKIGLPEGKLAIVRCGVSLTPPDTWPVPREKNMYCIGTLGRLVEKKGMDILLKAVAGLPNMGLSIVGDGPLRSELEVLADDLGISARVNFVGTLSHLDVADWMAGLDLFVLACKQDRNGDMDGIPVCLMEAMSQGVPVVSTWISGIPELVIHEETGLLAMPGDSDSLRQQITRMFESCELRKQLARAAAIHVNGEFGQKANVDRLLSHFGLVPA
jgi:colanic acid/amylovoran biosynthesis glycosyltransferase